MDAEPAAEDDVEQKAAEPAKADASAAAAETGHIAAITGSSSSSSSTAPVVNSGKVRHENGYPVDDEGLYLCKRAGCSSKYAGVGWAGGKKQSWVAQGKHNHVNDHLGYFKVEREAAIAFTNWKRKRNGMPEIDFPAKASSGKQTVEASQTSPDVVAKSQEAEPHTRNNVNSIPPETGLSNADTGREAGSQSGQDAEKASAQKAPESELLRAKDVGNASASACPELQAAGSAGASQPSAEEFEDDMFDLLIKEAAAQDFKEAEQDVKKEKKKEKEKMEKKATKEMKEKKHKKQKKDKKEKKAMKEGEKLQEIEEEGEHPPEVCGNDDTAAQPSKARARFKHKFFADKDGLFLNDRTTAAQTSLYMGVSFNIHKQLWDAQGKADNRNTHFGLFQSEKEAAAAYTKWKKDLLLQRGIEPFIEEVDVDAGEKVSKPAKHTNGKKRSAESALVGASREARASKREDTGQQSVHVNGSQCSADDPGAEQSLAEDADENVDDFSGDENGQEDSDVDSDGSSSSSSSAQPPATARDMGCVKSGLRVLTYRDAVEWLDAQRALLRATSPQVPQAFSVAPGTPKPVVAPGTPKPVMFRPTPGTPTPGGNIHAFSAAPGTPKPAMFQPGPGTPTPGGAAASSAGRVSNEMRDRMASQAAQSFSMPATPARSLTATPARSATFQAPLSSSAAALAASSTGSASKDPRDWMLSQALHPPKVASSSQSTAGAPSTPAPQTPSFTGNFRMQTEEIDQDDAYDSIFAETGTLSNIQQELETLLVKRRQENISDENSPASKRRKEEWEEMTHIEPGTYLTGPVSEEEEIARQQEFEQHRRWEQEMSLAREAGEQQRQRQERLRGKRKALAQAAAAAPTSAQLASAVQAADVPVAAAAGEAASAAGTEDAPSAQMAMPG